MFDIEILARNIREFRITRGYSQNALATRLGVSPQCVSKWERGKAVPDLDNLCLLSDVLNVPADSLLGAYQNTARVMIGIDGGCSNTEFVCFSEDGTVLGTTILGGCNPNMVGMDNCCTILKNGIVELMQLFPSVSGIYVGGAGFFTNRNGDRIKSNLKKTYPHVQLDCQSDITNVIAATAMEQSCIAVICDAGSVVYVKEQQKMTCLAGWRYLFNKVGNGADIGRDALLCALRDREGFGESTQITELIEMKSGQTVEEIVDTAYKKGSTYLAEFASVVFEAYRNGDPVAASILTENASRLAYLINCTSKKYNCGDTVIISGSVVAKHRIYSDMIAKMLDPGLRLMVSELPQSLGACFLAAKMMGVDHAAIKEKLIEGYMAQRTQYAPSIGGKK